MSDSKFYWLKLKRDFFKRHDIQILESMPNGKEYSLFYLKLLCESIDHDGELRFSDTIPYNEQMLATITNTNVDVVRVAVKVLCELDMMEVMDDGTLYMTEVQGMIGSAVNNDNANRQRRFRENKKLSLQDRYASVTKNNESKSIEIDIDKEKEIEIEEKQKRFTPPSLSEVQEYVKERNSQVDPKQFYDYFTAGGWKDSKGNQVKNWKQKLITWEKFNVKEAPKRTLNNFNSSETTSEDLDDWSQKNQDDFYSRWGGNDD